MSYHDMVCDIVRIKGVGRITGGKHHIVGDIHKRVDWAHAHLPDPVLHLIRRWFYTYAGHFHADVSGTSVRIVDLHLKIRLYIGCKRLNFLKRQVVKGRDLAGDTVMTPEIRTVCHGLIVNLQKHIIHIQSICQRGTGRNFKGRQVQNLRFLLCREQFSQSDLIGSTDHTEGSDTAELGILDHHRLALAVPTHNGSRAGYGHPHTFAQIDTTADDVLDLTVSDIYLAHPQTICVRVRLDSLDHTHNHIVEPARQFFHIFYLYRGHGQIIGQLLQIHVLRDIHIIFYP